MTRITDPLLSVSLSQYWLHNKRNQGRTPHSQREQGLTDERTVHFPGAGKKATPYMRGVLVHHVEFRHFLEDPDKTSPWILLPAQEQQACIHLHALTPWGPAFGGVAQSVIVGIGTTQDLGPSVFFRGGKTRMGVLDGNRIPVTVFLRERKGLEFIMTADGGTTVLLSPHRLFLKTYRGTIPVFERNTDNTRDEITAALHPWLIVRRGPDETIGAVGVLSIGIDRPILEAHQVSRCLTLAEIWQEARLRPARRGNVIGPRRVRIREAWSVV